MNRIGTYTSVGLLLISAFMLGRGSVAPQPRPVVVFPGGAKPGPVTLPADKPTTPATRPAAWPVVRVVDGDTAVVRWAPAKPADERLRLLNVNTPERGQPGYAEAKQALAALVGDGPVRLEFETPDKPDRDRYGRPLVYLYARGQCVNVELVRLGWSRYETKYGEGRLADDFRAAEAEAREARRGLWGMDGGDGAR